MRRTPHRSRTALAVAAALALALAACGGGDGGSSSDKETRASSGGEVGTRAPVTARPGPTATQKPTGGSGVSTRNTNPTVAAATPWAAPDVRFYNEDWSIWAADQSVANQDYVSSEGSIEGFRTYDGSCIMVTSRDVNEAIHDLGLDDDLMSSSMLDLSNDIKDFAETGRETLSLVRDDGGTMEGYSITYTGTETDSSGTTFNVAGYAFTRAVGDAGLKFEVLAECQAEYNLTPEQWQTTLSGIKLTGVSAGSMS